MLKFSLPVIIGGSVLAVGATLGTVAVAMPGFAPPPEVTATSNPAPSDTGTGSGSWTTPVDNTQHEVAPGMRAQDLPAGFNAIPYAGGVSFTYFGPCVDPSAKITVWTNIPGMWQSQGDTCRWKKAGEHAWFTTTLTWGTNTTNAYCSTKQSAYRAEVFGQFTGWVEMPDAYKTCPTVQPYVPGSAPSPRPVAPASPAPVTSPSSSTSSSASPTPTGTATP